MNCPPLLISYCGVVVLRSPKRAVVHTVLWRLYGFNLVHFLFLLKVVLQRHFVRAEEHAAIAFHAVGQREVAIIVDAVAGPLAGFLRVEDDRSLSPGLAFSRHPALGETNRAAATIGRDQHDRNNPSIARALEFLHA